MAELSLPAKVLALHAGLTDCRVAHAFGGALALAYYAEPRATIDIDLNLFVSASDFPVVAGIVEPLGVDITIDRAAVDRDGQCRLRWGRTPLDLFFAYDPFHDAMKDAFRTVPFADGTIPVLSPEHLLVCKAAFDRPKDWLDIEQMLVATEELDRAEASRWLDRIVGEHDQRAARFSALAEQYLGPARG